MKRIALLLIVTIFICYEGAIAQKLNDTRINPVDHALMVWVPATSETCVRGKFRMGLTSDEIRLLWAKNGWDTFFLTIVTEHEERDVGMAGFWIYKYEVTNSQYADFLRATGHKSPDFWQWFQDNPNLPVTGVRWDDAMAYCKWAKVALPSEAQWEYAARGPKRSTFPWGNDWDHRRCNNAEYIAGKPLKDLSSWLNWVKSSIGTGSDPGMLVPYLRPPGSFPTGVSWCGAMDMAGNVAEWCSDYYGPPAPRPHCLRGGGWVDLPFGCLSGTSIFVDADKSDVRAGFRPVLIN